MPKTKTKKQFIKMLDVRVREVGTQSAFAEKFGLKQQYVSKLLKGKLDPAGKILTALGYRRKTVYEEIEK